MTIVKGTYMTVLRGDCEHTCSQQQSAFNLWPVSVHHSSPKNPCFLPVGFLYNCLALELV